YFCLKDQPLPVKMFSLREIIRKENPDVIHSHLFRSVVISRFAARRKDYLINSYHTAFHDPASIEFSYKQLIADKLTFRKRFVRMYVSNTVARSISKALNRNGREYVLPNFVDERFVPAYNPKPSAELKVVMVGNYREQKNHALAIWVLSEAKCRTKISIDIYGSGHLEASLLALIERLGVNVKLKGLASINSQLLGRYDLFLMTSLHEGLPLALIEAMASGLPCLLNNIAELQEAGGSAAYYFEKNNQSDLAKALDLLSANRDELPKRSILSIEQSGKYDQNTYFAQLLKIYSNG
ncbi:MAG: glycosyltransferase, partial [Imperialibacter sp.]